MPDETDNSPGLVQVTIRVAKTRSVAWFFGTIGLLPLLILLFLLGMGMAVLGASQSGTCNARLSGNGNANGITIAGKPISAEQSTNATIIMSLGVRRGLSKRDIKLGLMVGLQESKLINNPDHRDRDSGGIFQQRPSQGWGTAQQVRDPIYATNTFYDHLVAIPSRDQMPSLLDVALAVQHPSRAAYLSPSNNFPDWESTADQLLSGQPLGAASCTTGLGIAGKVTIVPGANLPGRDITPETMNFLAQVAGIYGKQLIVTTGTNHGYYTVDGNVSDHSSGHAADIGMIANGGYDDSPVGDAIMAACLAAAGDPPAQAAQEAIQGGLYNRYHSGLRIQCIWKTYIGGNHHNHVHIGASPQ